MVYFFTEKVKITVVEKIFRKAPQQKPVKNSICNDPEKKTLQNFAQQNTFLLF